MVGNIVVNAILAAVLFGAYSWTPWASLVLASLSSLAFSHILIFDRAFLEEISKEGIDKLSLLIGAGISYVGVVASIIALMVLR